MQSRERHLDIDLGRLWEHQAQLGAAAQYFGSEHRAGLRNQH
jgi:hypothetical protein